MRLKRLISAFIACAMLVTFMPMQAFATPDDELYEVSQSQQDNSTVLDDQSESDVEDDTSTQQVNDSQTWTVGESKKINCDWWTGLVGEADKYWTNSDYRVVQLTDYRPIIGTVQFNAISPGKTTITLYEDKAHTQVRHQWNITVKADPRKSSDRSRESFEFSKDSSNVEVAYAYKVDEDVASDLYPLQRGETICLPGKAKDYPIAFYVKATKGYVPESTFQCAGSANQYSPIGTNSNLAQSNQAKEKGYTEEFYFEGNTLFGNKHREFTIKAVPVKVSVKYSSGNTSDNVSGMPVEDNTTYTHEDVDDSVYQHEIVLPSQEPSRKGYTFKEWKLESDGITLNVEELYQPGDKITLDDNTWDSADKEKAAITFVAQWKEIEEPAGSTDAYFYVLKPESQDNLTTTDPQHFYYVGQGSLQGTPQGTTDFNNGVAGQIQTYPNAEQLQSIGADAIAGKVGENFANVFWYRVSQASGANGNPGYENPVSANTLAWHVDGILKPENPNYQVRFILRQGETETVLNVYDIESGNAISDQNIQSAADNALRIGNPGEGYVVRWKDAKGQVVTDEQIIADTSKAQPEMVLVFYAEFVQPAMPTVQEALADYKKTVTAPESVETFQPTVFKFKLEKQGADEGWKDVESLTGKLSTVPVSQSVQNLTIAGTTDALEAGTYRLSEIQTAEDLMSWEKNDQQFEFTVTDEGEIVRTKEATVFVNTYLAPDLSIEKALTLVNGQSYNDGQSVQSGDVLTYQITVKNDGNQDARGSFNVTDSMWSGNGLLDSVEFKNANGETSNSSVEYYPISSGTVVVQEIPASSQYVFTYDYTVQMADEGKTLSNTVKLTSSDVYIDDSVDVEVEKTHCTITYEYQSGTDGKQLPTDLLPAVPEAQVFHVGDSMNEVPVPGKTTIETEDGTWQFKGWYSERIMLNLPVCIDKDMHIIGLWNFYEYNTHNVKVQYVLEDKDGEVTPIDKPTLPATHGAPWQVKVSDSERLTDVNNLVVARAVKNNDKHYVFKEFRNDELSGTVTKDVQIVAVYGLDEIGGGTDPKQPDGIPDEYQATVTYRVVNGTWSDGTDADQVEIFTLYEFHPETASWTRIPDVTLGNTIPTGMLADANYVGQRGAWNEDITSETAVTGDVTYIYRFGDAAADEIVVYYDDDGSGYGEVTSAPRQVFTKAGWQTIPGSTTRVRIHLTATAEDDGGRTYFDEWQGSLVDNLDRDITENENLDVWVEAEIGQTYTIIADFGRNSGGGAHHPDARDDDDDDNDRDDEDDTEESIDEEVPLAETPWLNTEDHYAYIIGYAEDGTVRPNANITRAEVATIFFRLLTDEARDQFWMTTNNFSDVLPNDWYNNAVSTMVNMGIIQGYEDGTFRPNANITRAEFAAIAARFMSSGYGVEDDLFTDIANHWARESINDAAMAGWINGYEDGTFRPDAAITRAEAVTLVNNVLQRKPDADHMFDSMIKWPDNPEGTWYYEAIQEATNSHDYDLFEDAEYETWTALQENRDWAALEKDWVNAHRTGGEVM